MVPASTVGGLVVVATCFPLVFSSFLFCGTAVVDYMGDVVCFFVFYISTPCSVTLPVGAVSVYLAHLWCVFLCFFTESEMRRGLISLRCLFFHRNFWCMPRVNLFADFGESTSGERGS